MAEFKLIILTILVAMLACVVIELVPHWIH